MGFGLKPERNSKLQTPNSKLQTPNSKPSALSELKTQNPKLKTKSSAVLSFAIRNVFITLAASLGLAVAGALRGGLLKSLLIDESGAVALLGVK